MADSPSSSAEQIIHLKKKNREMESQLQRVEAELRAQAEANIDETISLLQTTLDATADGILAVNAQGGITYFNRKFLELWQIPESVLELRDDRQLLPFMQKQLHNPDAFLNQVKTEYAHMDLEERSLIKFKDNRVFERYSKAQVLNGEIIGRVINYRDVTAFKQANEALYKSEERFSKAFRANPIPSAISTLLEGRIIDVNDRFCSVFGYQPQEVINRTVAEVHIWSDMNDRVQLLQLLQQQQSVHNVEIRYCIKSGEVRDGIASFEVMELSGELCLLSQVLDITDRKQAELALKESEQRFRALIEQASDAIFIANTQGVYIDVNTSACQMLGYTRDELIGKRIIDIIPSDDIPQLAATKEFLLTGNIKLEEWSLIHKDGTRILVEASTKILPDNRWQIFVRDISDRKQIETKLQQNQQLLQSIIDAAPMKIYLKDLQGRYILYNQYCQKITELKQEQIIGKTDRELFSPALANQFQSADQEALKSGKVVTHERTLREADKVHTYITTKFPVFDADGNPYGVCGISTDISDRKQIEEALRVSEERFSKAFRANPAATAITTLSEGRYVDINDSFLNLLQFSRDEVIGKTAVELGLWVNSSDRATVLPQIIEQLRQQPIYNLEVQFRNKTGEVRDGITSIELIDLSGELCMLSQLHDVTEHKRTEAALRYRLEFEALLTTISTQFINLKATAVEQGINQALQQIGEFAQVDRVCIFMIPDEGDRFLNTHQWCADGAEPLVYPPEGLPFSQIASTIEQLRQMKPIHVFQVEDLPEPRKSLSQSFGVKSYVAVPIASEGNLIGSLAFNSTRRCKSWSDEDIAILRAIADIFANALMRKRFEETLQNSEALYRTISEAVPDFIWSCDSQGYVDFVNSRWTNYTGLTLEAFNAQGGREQVYHPDDMPDLTQQWELAKQRGEWFEAEFRYRHKDGKYRWFIERGVPLKDASGAIAKWVGTITDIHDRKQVEEQLRLSLQEKEALLKEVHHRVKNNLQVVSSLLDLQSQYIHEPQILEMLRESQNRVRSMAFIHEKIYQSDSLAKVNLADYIQSLATHLIQIYAINPNAITLHLNLEPVTLNLDTALPCGLILNELLSNALKHAFSGNAYDTIWINLHTQPSNTYGTYSAFELTVGNNGAKLPELLNISKSDSLGFQLVAALVEQLHGEIKVTQENGVEFKLCFSELELSATHG